MASPMIRWLITDNSRYLEAWRLFQKNSTQCQCMQQFIESKLPDIVSSLGNEKPVIRVLSVGGGGGEIDLQILSKIHDRYPGASIYNDVIEPKMAQILSYKERVANTPDLDYINFTWHHKTSSEFELEVTKTKDNTKYDFIHMIQVLYYVNDVEATLQFYRNRLAPDGKLLVVLVSDSSGWSSLFKILNLHLPLICPFLRITGADITDLLRSLGAKYQCCNLESHLDITKCFVDGDRNGELLLDFITTIHEFKKISPELRNEIMQLLRTARCSSIKDGKIAFNNDLSAIVVENE